MSAPSFWLVIGVAGAGTFALRVIPFLAHGRVETPPALARLLRFVPAASLAALVIPGSILVNANGSYHAELPRILALAIAVGVAAKWRNVVLTLFVGMAALWVLQAVL